MRTHVLWLLAAELRKLIRPLVWGAGLAIIGFCLLITWGGANNARGALAKDAYPYGVKSNQKVLETVAEYSHEQGLTPRVMKLEEIFAPSTLDL